MSLSSLRKTPSFTRKKGFLLIGLWYLLVPVLPFQNLGSKVQDSELNLMCARMESEETGQNSFPPNS